MDVFKTLVDLPESTVVDLVVIGAGGAGMAAALWRYSALRPIQR